MDDRKIKTLVNVQTHDGRVSLVSSPEGLVEAPEKWTTDDLYVDCSGDPEGRNGVYFLVDLDDRQPRRSARIKVEADDVPVLIARIAERHLRGEDFEEDWPRVEAEQLAGLFKKILDAVVPYEYGLDEDEDDVEAEANRLVATVVGAAADWKREWVAANRAASNQEPDAIGISGGHTELIVGLGGNYEKEQIATAESRLKEKDLDGNHDALLYYLGARWGDARQSIPPANRDDLRQAVLMAQMDAEAEPTNLGHLKVFN